MPEKQPVILSVLIETTKQRWFVAGISMDGHPVPLMCSETGNLGGHEESELDEHVSFLRHRLAGVLQRGCDRLWGRQMKPSQIAFIADADFPSAAPELTQRVADHFVAWMTKPPVVFFTCDKNWSGDEEPSLHQIAGTISDADRVSVTNALPALLETLDEPDHWELSQSKPIS